MVPFCAFHFGGFLNEAEHQGNGTPIVEGLRGNLVSNTGLAKREQGVAGQELSSSHAMNLDQRDQVHFSIVELEPC